MKKILLINPPSGLYVREDRCQSAVENFAVPVVRPPLDLMIMAASAERVGGECRIVDYPMEKKGWDVFEADFKEFMPDVLVISVTTPSLKEDMKATETAKKLNDGCLTIAKGAHFSVFDRDVLEDFPTLDVAIRGECDIVLENIMKNGLEKTVGISYRKKGKIHRNPERRFLPNLDYLPIPARHLVKNELYTRPDTGEVMTIVETTRGCPYKCVYCLTGLTHGRRMRNRSPQTILEELKECVDKFNIRQFHFKADTFTADKEWLIEICDLIKKEGLKIGWICNSRVDTIDEERIMYMKEAGCWGIAYGVESGNQDILDKMKKGITLEQVERAVKMTRKHGVKTYAYFIIGMPWDSRETVEDSIEFAVKLNPDFVDFFIAYPFPGTEFEKMASEEGLISREKNTKKAYAEPIIRTLYLNSEEMMALREKALKRFYMRPGYILRMLLTAKSPRIAYNYIKAGINLTSSFSKGG